MKSKLNVSVTVTTEGVDELIAKAKKINNLLKEATSLANEIALKTELSYDNLFEVDVK